MPAADDHVFMARALRLAARAAASTDPNPAVGCVLVRDGRILGEGWTAPAGGPHAEIAALEAAGSDAAGATAYVSLEPCAHYGRTGPCAHALVEAQIGRVVAAATDPNPLVSGRGLETLRAAGIEVETGVLEASARELNRGYFARHARGRPFVQCKMAATLDGRTALANGMSQWITGDEARRDVHRRRARASAVMTGVGTVLADDPALTARPGEGMVFLPPARVVVDSALRTPVAAKVLEGPGEVYIFTGRDAAARGGTLAAAGARIEAVAADPRCDLEAVLARLGELELNDVWLEAGSELSGAMLAAGLVDELVLYFAPDLLGTTARGMFDFGPLRALGERLRFEIKDLRRLGRDLRVIARPAGAADA